MSMMKSLEVRLREIKDQLIAAHRAKDYELAAQLSQVKEKLKRKRPLLCAVCEVPLSRKKGKRPTHCKVHAITTRYYRRALAPLIALWLLTAHCWAQPYTVRVQWEPVGSLAIAGFKLYFGTASRVYTNTVDAGTASSIMVSNLSGGVVYYFAGTAYDSNGVESEFSNELSYRPAPPVPVLLNGEALLVSPVDFFTSTNLIDWTFLTTGYAYAVAPITNQAFFYAVPHGATAPRLPIIIKLEP